MVSRTVARHGAVALCLFLIGCGETNLVHGNPGRTSTTVGLSTCTDLLEGEHLAGVSPDGRAWITSVDGLRVIDPDGASQDIAVRYGAADELVAWTSDRAFVVSESQLWDTRLDNSQPFILPDNLGRPRYACGDPEAESGAFILGTRGLFERRGGEWYRWEIPVDVFESMKIRHIGGACAADNDILYLTTTENTFWELRFGDNPFYRELGSIEEAHEIAVDSDHGLLRLFFGSLYRYEGEWEPIPFDGGFIMHMDAAGGVIWASVQDQLFRRDRFARWQQIEPDTTFDFIDSVQAYAAGGAWVIEESRLCHFGHRESVGVDGMRPFERVDQDNPPSQLIITADPTASMTLSANIDGRGVPVNGVSGLWTLGDLGAMGTGWHYLTLDLQGPLGPVQRVVPFRVEGDVVINGADPTVFYETDIKPIFDSYCAVCHGPDGTQRFIGDYETFSASAQGALDLIKSREMPPPPQPGPTQEEIGIIEKWIQEGMAP